jgi:proline iminopeptidase
VQRRSFDPDRHRIILFDQRGCGRSTPHASDPATDMGLNTTEHLLADMEQLRGHLGVDRWLLFGGSWGSTLILAYAERHPDRVSEIVIPSVTTSRRSETDWLYRGVARFFPAEWEQFRAGVPQADRDGDLVAAYARLMEHPDAEVRAKAAIDWTTWEEAVVSLEPSGGPNPYSDRPPAALLAFVRICARTISRTAPGWRKAPCFATPGAWPAFLACSSTAASISAAPWTRPGNWPAPGARLVVIGDSGHKGSDSMHQQVYAALDGFAPR